MATTPPLTSAQIAAAAHAYEAIRTHQTVYIVGPTGVGKTVVLEALFEELKSHAGSDERIDLRRGREGPPFELIDDQKSLSERRILLIDGLDEANPESLEKWIVFLGRWAALGGYTVVAMRPGLPLPESENAVIVLLSPEDVMREHQFEIYVDPGDADAVDIQELFEAISDLHAAAGGLGLEFHAGDNCVFALEEAQR